MHIKARGRPRVCVLHIRVTCYKVYKQIRETLIIFVAENCFLEFIDFYSIFNCVTIIYRAFHNVLRDYKHL